MRVLLLADVHANWEALLSLQRAEPKPDAVLFAGDAVGYGPDPANCARWLQANAAAVRGNHDEAASGQAATCPRGVPAELEQAALETGQAARQLLSAVDRAGLAAWPLTRSVILGGASFYLVHGIPADPLGGQIDPATSSDARLEALFGSVTAEVIVLGHTHLPALRSFGGRLIVNPGSLGQPRSGLPDATYAVWQDGQVQIRHLHYDHEAVERKLRLAALSPEVREQLVSLLHTGLLQPDLLGPAR
jgi:putative phosphoesterase